jgi:hypothetical protein
MSKAKRPKTRAPKRGRPTISDEPGERYQVTLPPRVAKHLRSIGDGSLTAGIIRDPNARRLSYLKETIQENKQQIEMLESGQMTVGYGPGLGTRQGAMAEAKRLRQKNEEWEVLVRQEEVWQKRQEAFFTVHRQFRPFGNGMPTEDAMDALEVADKEWREVQKEAQRIVDEIRAGKRK